MHRFLTFRTSESRPFMVLYCAQLADYECSVRASLVIKKTIR
jgi:hypothetical protein